MRPLRYGYLAIACALSLTATGLARAQAMVQSTTPAEVATPAEVTVPAQVPAPAETTAPLGLRVNAELPAPPSMGRIVWRVAVAAAVVGGLLAATLAMLRSLMGGGGHSPAVRARARWARLPRGWLGLWNRAGSRAADRLEILDRRPVGAKESVCVVRAGREQFLIGVTASRISLLGRLDPCAEAGEAGSSPAPTEAAAPPADVGEPAATDFACGLAEHTAARPSPDETSFRLLLARSRDRLSRLGLDSVHAGGRRD